MAKNPKQTGKKAAHTASGLLKKSSSKRVKKVAASDLSQAPYHKKKI